MSALSDALDHSQAKALAALFKAYTRRADDPDDELFAAMMRGTGLDDDLQIGFLLAAWRIMREYPEAVPATNGNGSQSKQVVENRRWTSGKYEGKSLADTPVDYLEWAAGGHPDPIARAAASDELQERMDTVGWHNQDDQRDYNYAVFRWMDEATREIQALRREVESLSRVTTSLSNIHP